jgi:REP element-mobilizing transposase RayT
MSEKFKNTYRIASARRQKWDYRCDASYFITICTKNRAHYFGEINDGKMELSHLGILADVFWNEITNHAKSVKLDEFVVMPNHVHVLFRLLGEHRLEEVIHSWKLFSASRINKMAGRFGKVWQAEYWDRLMRSQAHYDWTQRYIESNPGDMPQEWYSLWRRVFPSPSEE